ncbi:DUF2796 domain-containing protein [Vibrio sp. 99-70-13A1]|uniref:zinc uptake protein ZrgA n=1 Tax=Vibrio sp. 99-70-13A1 TaxID=2607601 RepID=UPI0014933A23|nr:DUF2796 domain-containing protein [Vibrio sp. 99-70-13A1]NOH97079.1 DUF2796 domain-containing protein [Vibrio sp. 99-70-13A1]
MKRTLISLCIGLTASHSALAEEHFRSHDAHVHGHVEVNIAQDNNELLIEVTAPGSDVVGFEHAPTTPEQIKALEHATAMLNQPENLFAFSNAQCELKFKSVSNSLEQEEHHAHEGHDHHDDKHDHDAHEGHDHHDDKHDHDDHEGHDHHDDKHDHDAHEGHDHHDDKHDHDTHEGHEHHDDKHDHDTHEGHEHHDDKHDHDAHEGHDDHKGHDHSEGGHGEFTVEYHYDCSAINKLDSISTQWFSTFTSTESMTVNLLTDTKQVQQKLTPKQVSFRF